MLLLCCWQTADELGAELGAVDLAGEALVQEALHQELQQYASSKNRSGGAVFLHS